MKTSMRRTALMAAFGLVLCWGMQSAVRAEQRYEGGTDVKESMRLAEAGKYDEAAATLKRLLEKKGANDWIAHFHLGLVYYKARRYDNALEEFSKTMALNKVSPMSYYFTALIYEAKAVNAEGASVRGVKQKALDSWLQFLDASSHAKPRPPAHRNIGSSVKESVELAQRHVGMLREELK